MGELSQQPVISAALVHISAVLNCHFIRLRSPFFFELARTQTLAMVVSSSSSRTSSTALEEERCQSPIPYRVGPLNYFPLVTCYCEQKAALWISWSDENPGRRYVKCYRGRVRSYFCSGFDVFDVVELIRFFVDWGKVVVVTYTNGMKALLSHLLRLCLWICAMFCGH